VTIWKQARRNMAKKMDKKIVQKALFFADLKYGR
jgi:hypothetical protein